MTNVGNTNCRVRCHALFVCLGFCSVETYRFSLEKVERCLDVGPLLENPTASLSFLWRQITHQLHCNVNIYCSIFLGHLGFLIVKYVSIGVKWNLLISTL